jgi:hypothetical protein
MSTYKNTLTYEEYENLDKQKVEEILKELIKEYFDENVPFMEYIDFDFGNYWERIEDDIKQYPTWGHIPESVFSINSEIFLKPDWKLWDSIPGESSEWQTGFYKTFKVYTNFFRIPRIIPYITFIDD